jgi:hypothetical protein
VKGVAELYREQTHEGCCKHGGLPAKEHELLTIQHLQLPFDYIILYNFDLISWMITSQMQDTTLLAQLTYVPHLTVI